MLAMDRVPKISKGPNKKRRQWVVDARRGVSGPFAQRIRTSSMPKHEYVLPHGTSSLGIGLKLGGFLLDIRNNEVPKDMERPKAISLQRLDRIEFFATAQTAFLLRIRSASSWPLILSSWKIRSRSQQARKQTRTEAEFVPRKESSPC